MTQDQLTVLLLKVAVIGGFISLVSWVVIYIKLTHWGALRNPIGRTLVIKSLLVAFLLVPFTLSLFFHLTRTDSRVTGWMDVVLIGAISPVMWWRSIVWIRESRKGNAPGSAE